MWMIIAGIILIIVIAYSLTSTAIDNTMVNMEEDKWWLVGMFADMHNKKHDRK